MEIESYRWSMYREKREAVANRHTYIQVILEGRVDPWNRFVRSISKTQEMNDEVEKKFGRRDLREATEKEHWERLVVLLFSEDKENVVMGMNLLETLDEEVYYDGVCTYLKDDEKGNGR